MKSKNLMIFGLIIFLGLLSSQIPQVSAQPTYWEPVPPNQVITVGDHFTYDVNVHNEETTLCYYEMVASAIFVIDETSGVITSLSLPLLGSTYIITIHAFVGSCDSPYEMVTSFSLNVILLGADPDPPPDDDDDDIPPHEIPDNDTDDGNETTTIITTTLPIFNPLGWILDNPVLATMAITATGVLCSTCYFCFFAPKKPRKARKKR